ncbi:MAG TPA: M20/M25/M40 family metallo-hydrolase, partial [Caldilineaceae bacterium]|nr:M20/M25/M40 family metallo-hydrolase [Caldilineaceae bacterium]
GHLDVVMAEPDKWSHPPFSGHKDASGMIYGRGATDMKQTVTAALATLLAVKKNFHDRGQRPKRDVIFLALADEETGGVYGARWMAENHAELFADAEFALNEGGGIAAEINGVYYMTIQAGEKGTSRFWLRARGTPGHGSVPMPNAGIVRLADAVRRLGSTWLPVHMTATTRRFLQVLADTQKGQNGVFFRQLLHSEDPGAVMDAAPLDPTMRRNLNAVLRNTAMPTILRSGGQLNVIPDVAEAGIDGRLLPGQSRADFEREIRAVLGPELADLEIEWATPQPAIALEAELEGPLLDAINAVMAVRAPGTHLLPNLVTGGTDAKAIAPLGVKVFGFSPHPADDLNLFERAHAHDERLHEKSFHYCVRTTYEIVERVITKSV